MIETAEGCHNTGTVCTSIPGHQSVENLCLMAATTMGIQNIMSRVSLNFTQSLLIENSCGKTQINLIPEQQYHALVFKVYERNKQHFNVTGF